MKINHNLYDCVNIVTYYNYLVFSLCRITNICYKHYNYLNIKKRLLLNASAVYTVFSMLNCVASHFQMRDNLAIHNLIALKNLGAGEVVYPLAGNKPDKPADALEHIFHGRH